MSSSLEIDNKKLQPVIEAAASVGYSRDYVTKLARDKKITAIQIGRQWFVEPSSLELYATQSLAEQKIRQQQLSELRKEEREKTQQRIIDEIPLTPFFVRVSKQKSSLAMMGLLALASTYSLIHFSSLTSDFGTASVVTSTVTPEFQTTETDYEIAVGTTVSPQEPVPLEVDFSQESVRMTDIKHFKDGILLLPYATSTDTVSPEQLFSDEVKIVTDEQGRQFVQRVNDQNQTVSEIPFVVVPVDSNQTTP